MSSLDDATPEEHLAHVRAEVAAAARAAGRSPDSVRILAVSKTFPYSAIAAAARLGQVAFGESRVQEARDKIEAARADASTGPLEWHLIGALQRNKTRLACELFDVIQSLDRPVLADALSRHAQAAGRVLDVFLQVNVDEEPGKAGVPPREAQALLAHVVALPGLRPRGLMAIPRWHPDPEDTRPSFARLRALAEELRLLAPEGIDLAELSMGMSGDYPVAIQEGATWVRLGTALFGRRTA